MQNAAGGVDGRQIKLVVRDDASSPTTNQIAASELKGSAFGVIENTALDIGGAKTLEQAGVPVTGVPQGPEWGEQPYTNMFAIFPVFAAPFGGRAYGYDYVGSVMKSVGVTKVAGMSYGESPASQNGVNPALASAEAHGISVCTNIDTVPIGGVDFTADVLALKSERCNGVAVAVVDSSAIALAQDIKNAGLHAPIFIDNTAYDNQALATPAVARSLDGNYIDIFVNFTTPNGPTQAMLKALKKYDPQYSGGIPSYGEWTSYVAADLMVQGLERAKSDLTRANFLSQLHGVSSYDAGGVLPGTIGFSLHDFGTTRMLPSRYCDYTVEVVGRKYVPTNGGKPWCGGLVSAKSAG